MLVDLWEKILCALEGGANAAVLLGIDYEKAFNRMEHAVCLKQLQRLGASPGSLSLVRAFLEDRTMTIVIDGAKAKPAPIRRGSPQGSVLGCLLYCITTQSLTAGETEHSQQRLEVVFFPQDSPGDELVEMWAADTEKGHQQAIDAFLYVDDTTLVDAVPIASAVRHITTGITEEVLPVTNLEEAFVDLETGAGEIGMVINKKKTQLLTISPPNGCNTTAMIRVGEHEVVSQKEMKLVGFMFCDKPDASGHVAQIREKFKVRIWMMYHLRRAGFKERQLYRLYCCYLRTVIEHCAVVYHSLLSAGQREDLERIHRHAIRICYGRDRPIAEVMQTEMIETLEARRVRRCDGFIRKAVANPTFAGHWFLARPESGHVLRRRRQIFEPRAGSARFFNSPLSFLRRRANELGYEGVPPIAIDMPA